MRIVILTWPDDSERGPEVYGPFRSDEEQDKWAEEVTASMPGVYSIETRVSVPFPVTREEPPKPGTPEGIEWGKRLWQDQPTEFLIEQRRLSQASIDHNAAEGHDDPAARDEVTVLNFLLAERGVE